MYVSSQAELCLLCFKAFGVADWYSLSIFPDVETSEISFTTKIHQILSSFPKYHVNTALIECSVYITIKYCLLLKFLSKTTKMFYHAKVMLGLSDIECYYASSKYESYVTKDCHEII